MTWDTNRRLALLLKRWHQLLHLRTGNLPLEQISNRSKVLYFHHDQTGLHTNAHGEHRESPKLRSPTTPYGNLTGSTGTATTPLGYDGQ